MFDSILSKPLHTQLEWQLFKVSNNEWHWRDATSHGQGITPFVLFPKKLSFRVTRIAKKQFLVQTEAIFSAEISKKSRNYDLLSFETTKFVLSFKMRGSVWVYLDTEFNYLEKLLGTNQIIRYKVLTKTESSVFNEPGPKKQQLCFHASGCGKPFFVLSMCILKETVFHFGSFVRRPSTLVNWILNWIRYLSCLIQVVVTF